MLQNKSENHWSKVSLTLYPAKRQDGSCGITDLLSKILMSAYILKYHKMLLMSHLNKTDHYYHQGSTNRHMDQESKYCENYRQLNGYWLSQDFV